MAILLCAERIIILAVHREKFNEIVRIIGNREVGIQMDSLFARHLTEIQKNYEFLIGKNPFITLNKIIFEAFGVGYAAS